MGMSATAYLLYGVPLGGGEWDPTFTDHVDEDGIWMPPWADPDADDDDSTVSELVDERLREYRFSETYNGRGEVTGVGVTFSGYLAEGADPVLRVFEFRVDAGDLSRAVDFAELERRRVGEDWDGQLVAALTALGITTAPLPGWHLVANYG